MIVISFQISHRLVFGAASFELAPAPKLLGSSVIGVSLEASIPKVGAQVSVHPGRPENISGSIQDAKFSVLSKAVGLSPFKLSTHAKNSFSHSFRIEK